MITVSVSGFSNKEQAQVFVDWYYGQGEQDAGYWFDEWCPEVNPCELKCEVKEDTK
jgi:ABC-type Fe3+ transport system substrate-binding protein